MYRILIPLSYLPLWFVYIASTIFWPIAYYIVRYRLKVVRYNLKRCFPEKSKRELRKLERQYFQHLCDLLAEGLFNIRASVKKVARRYRFVNADILEPYYRQNRSVVLMSAHYNNWEYMITSLNSRISHQAVGVGKPLNNKNFGVFLTARRARYGTEIVDQTNVRQAMSFYDQWHIPAAYMMLSDQSPSRANKCYWTKFFDQDTAFLYGSEHFARKYNMAVFFYEVKKIRRGRYELHFKLITDTPNELPQGEITERYVHLLEETIRKEPQYWLWSHRRWKLKKTCIPQ